MQCFGEMAGTRVVFTDSTRVNIQIYGDDGPWETQVSGKFFVRDDEIVASNFETVSVEGPAPFVGTNIEIVWQTILSGHGAQLEMTKVSGAEIARPWLSVGNLYVRSRNQCNYR